MLKNRIVIAVIAGSAAAVPLVGMTPLTAAPAGAATPSAGIICKAATGTVNTTTDTANIKLLTCSGNTGGSGKTQGKEGQTSGTVTWANADKTTSTVTETNGTKCPSGSIADEVIKGNVTKDTTGSTAKGAALHGEICISSALKVSLAPGTKWTYAA